MTPSGRRKDAFDRQGNDDIRHGPVERRTRLAIVSTHPIQYYAPVFRLLAQRRSVALRVFYGWKGTSKTTEDKGFGKAFAWDIPLLEGYDFEFVPNVSRDPGSHRYAGIDLPELNERIAVWQADAILVFGWCYKAHLKAMRYFHGRIPVLFRGDSTLLDETPGWRRALRRVMLRWVYHHVDLALYVGTQNRLYYEAHGLHPEKLIFAPHAIDNDRFGGARGGDLEIEAQQWRRELGIGDDEVVILFAGKLEPKKAPDLLLSAFAGISGTGKAHLAFAGIGPLEAQLRERSVPRTHFLGFQNQTRMPIAYRVGDITILPSVGPQETWGLALNEAMACGRAVAASDRVGAAIDLIEARRSGWVFSAGNFDALRQCLEKIVQTGREALREMGRRSAECIAQWSFEQQIRGIEQALDQAIIARK